MSGVLGFWNLDGRPVDRAVLWRMSDTLGHRGPDGTGHRIIASFGMVHHHFWTTREDVGESQPIVSSGGVLLAMDGRLDNRDELLQAFSLGQSTTDAACVLAAYEAWPADFARRLNGDFAVAVFDPARARLVLVRDAIGVRPLYYVHNGRFVAFASEVKALLAHPEVHARANDDGVADLMALGFRPSDRQDVTCFAGISALVPAHVAIVTPDRMQVRRYWDFEKHRSLRFSSVDEYVDAFREQFATAVRRRLRSQRPVAVSVSGGVDSSSIFCEALSLQRHRSVACPDIVGVSYVGPVGSDADEKHYVSAIEQHYGVDIEQFPIRSFIGLIDGAEEQVRAIEAPVFDYMWRLTSELHRRARSRGARVVLSGLWGDQVLFSSAYLVDLARRLAWREIGQHVAAYRSWLGRIEARILVRRFARDVIRHCAPPALVRPLKWMRVHLSRRLQSKPWMSDAFRTRALGLAGQPVPVPSGFHSAQASALYAEVRSKYHVHCLECNNKAFACHGLDVAFPFLDRDLLAFLMAIPGEIQNPDGVPRGLIREAMHGVLPEAVRTRKGKADFTALINEGMAAGAEEMVRELSAASLSARLGYSHPQRLEAEAARLAEHLTGLDCGNSWDLADLFGLEVWLRVFLAAERDSRSESNPTVRSISNERTRRASAREKAVPNANADDPR